MTAVSTRSVIDLRSDTVTRPSPAMREAIAHAEVGDDVLGHDPTVLALEERVASLLGKEAALFVPSGTMANQISIRGHASPGTEVIAERWSHVLNFEAGASAALWGVAFCPLDGTRGVLSAEAVRESFRPPVAHVPRTSLVWVENSHNYAGGNVWEVRELDAVAAVAHEAGIPFHLDGARIWNAAVALGVAPAAVAASADTVTVCMSKGLGAPVGSLVVGPRSFIERCWVIRKQMGGGMRQSGILAAAALYGLESNMSRLAEDHANARFLAEKLSQVEGVTIDLQAARTNIVVFDVSRLGTSPLEIVSRCAKEGLLLVPFGSTRVRAVTHLDVDRAGVERAWNILSDVLEKLHPLPQETH